MSKLIPANYRDYKWYHWLGIAITSLLLVVITESCEDNKRVNNKEGSSTGPETAQSASSSFKKNVRYKYYTDGSCRPYPDEECVDLATYKTLCQRATGILDSNLRGLYSVLFSGEYASFIKSGGSLSDTMIRWSEGSQECLIGFKISGLFKGTSTTEQYRGVATNFILIGTNQFLITHASAN